MSQVVHQVVSPLDSGRLFAVMQSEEGTDFWVADCAQGQTVIELDDLNRACLYADGLALQHTIKLIEASLDGREDAILAVGFDLNSSAEGDSILLDDQVASSASFDVDAIVGRENLLDISGSITGELALLQQNPLLKNNPPSVLVAVTSDGLEGADEDADTETKYVIATFQYDIAGNISQIGFLVLRAEYQFMKDSSTISQRMLDVMNSPMHEVYIEEAGEYEDWLPVIESMPHFSKVSTQAERVYVFEGGPVLEHLTAERPWEVETGANGLPVPLRIVQVQDDQEFGMTGMKFEVATQAGQFLEDTLRSESALVRQISPRAAVKHVVSTTLAAWDVNEPCGPKSGGSCSGISPSM